MMVYGTVMLIMSETTQEEEEREKRLVFTIGKAIVNEIENKIP